MLRQKPRACFVLKSKGGAIAPPFFELSATARGASARIALQTRAVAHQREVQALPAHLTFVAFGFSFGAAFGGYRLCFGTGSRLGPLQLLERLGRREFLLGLGLERGGAGGFAARAGGGDCGDVGSPTSSSFARAASFGG
jgi:hypothetical protein